MKHIVIAHDTVPLRLWIFYSHLLDDISNSLILRVNFFSLIYLNFHRLVVSRYRDPQVQVAKNYSYFINSDINICKF